MKTQKPNKYFEIKVAMEGPAPEIFRTFLIKAGSTFSALHKAIQDCSGTWRDSHLYNFSHASPFDRELGRDSVFAISGWDETSDYMIAEYAADLKLTEHFDGTTIGKNFYYSYDYGDGWVCRLTHISTQILEEKFTRQLLAGARAFPPEDCGGLHGYEECSQIAVNTKKNRKDYDLKNWMGDWHPEKFDLQTASQKFLRPKAQDSKVIREKSSQDTPRFQKISVPLRVITGGKI